MKKLLFLYFQFLFPFLSSADYWTQKADFGGIARAFATSVHIGNVAYAGLGNNSSGSLNDWWKYDKPTNTWVQMANFPGAGRTEAFGFAIGNFAYVACGINPSGLLKEVWQYDSGNNSWVQKNDFPGTARAGAKGFVINGRAFMGSGQVTVAPQTFINDFWEYEPLTDSWIQKNNLPGAARTEALGMAINATGYYGLGLAAGNSIQNDFWQYDTLTDAWLAQPNYGGPPAFGVARFSLLNNGYVGTGFISLIPVFTNEWWQFDPATQQWTQKTSYAGFASGAAISFSIYNKGYVGLSEQTPNSWNTELWEYSPDSTTGIADIQIEKETVARFIPDPIVSSSVFEISKYESNADLYLNTYDAAGRRVRHLSIKNKTTSIDKGNLHAGLYFYYLVSHSSGSIVAKGKLMVN